ncbi:MAG: hypothetical protein QW428_07075, partial [Conexivisphaerales archaeon]
NKMALMFSSSINHIQANIQTVKAQNITAQDIKRPLTRWKNDKRRPECNMIRRGFLKAFANGDTGLHPRSIG